MNSYHKSHRRSLLAKVHIGKKEMAWDRSIYETVLEERYGHASASKLSDAQLADLCGYFQAQGVKFKSRPKPSQKPRSRNYLKIPNNTPYADQKRYIAALWNKLGFSMAGLDKRAQQQFGVEKFVWLNNQIDLQTLARDLNNRCKKRGISADAI